jgi:thioredoxin reductase (NADPH)
MDIVIIGAGPAGISMAAEARTAGVASDNMLVIEKAPEHSFTLKRYYPDDKLVTANYKGFDVVCTGVLCMPDLTKHETISYLDRALTDHGIIVHYGETVHAIAKSATDQRFAVHTDRSTYQTRVVVVAIGILGKPNKPEYQLPRTLKNRFLFDVTSIPIEQADVLVVGGGDSASEYSQYLVQRGNRVTLSYRRTEFVRMNEINKESLQALAQEGRVVLRLGSTIDRVSDANGKPAVYYRETNGEAVPYDFVVYALGGSTPENFLKAIGIDFEGPQPRLKEAHETSVPGLFLVGDLSAGPKGGSIIWAFNSANTAMRKICRDYLL